MVDSMRNQLTLASSKKRLSWFSSCHWNALLPSKNQPTKWSFSGHTGLSSPVFGTTGQLYRRTCSLFLLMWISSLPSYLHFFSVKFVLFILCSLYMQIKLKSMITNSFVLHGSKWETRNSLWLEFLVVGGSCRYLLELVPSENIEEGLK